MSSRKAFLPLVAMLLITGDVARAQGPTTNEDVGLTMAGSVERPVKLGLSDLTRMPHKSVHVKDHDGKDVMYEGVPLIEVLKLAGVPSAGAVAHRSTS